MKFFSFSAVGFSALNMLLGQPAAAQPSTGGPAPDAPDTTEPAAVPLDSGASLLLASGVAYGIRQLRARRLARHTSK